jgi:hypothetical protein
MNKINYSDAKRDNTLYRYRGESAVVETTGFIRLIYDIRPTSDMPIIINVPIGTGSGTANEVTK